MLVTIGTLRVYKLALFAQNQQLYAVLFSVGGPLLKTVISVLG